MMAMFWPRHAIGSVLLCALVVGCGASSDVTDEGSTTIAPVATIGGVGSLPPEESTVAVSVEPPTSVEVDAGVQLLGALADGNRVLLLGDSILASTSPRYGNQMCETLVPLGWQVAVEAEPSRFVEFGNNVLDAALRADASPVEDWNAAVVFLGSNYRGDALAYEAQLREMLTRLAPRPTLLLTVTEYRPEWSEVNEVVTRVADGDDNVMLLDWKTIAEEPGVLSGDRLHPTEAGRQVLADAVAASLGPASPSVGECLQSVFRDDSGAGSDAPTVLGPPASTSSETTGSGSSGSTGSSGSGSSGSGSSGSTGSSGSGGASPPATSPPATSPPATTPPATSPPATAPPATSPPATSPPATSPPATTPLSTPPPATAPSEPEPAPTSGGDGASGTPSA